MTLNKNLKILVHTLFLCFESAILITLVFYMAVSGLDFPERAYTKKPQDVRFAVASGQSELLRDLQYFRVDYTTHSRPVANDDSDFIARQMIHVPCNKEDPYAEYCVSLPSDVLKVRINTHYKKGKEHITPIKMRTVFLGRRELKDGEFELYRNYAFNFYGQCYTPKPFMRGYYVEYFWLIGVTVVVVFTLSVWYFRRQRDEEECEDFKL